MAIATAKLSELPLRNSLPFPLTCHSLFSSTLKPPFQSLRKSFRLSSSLQTNENPKPTNHIPSPKAPWLSKWGPDNPPPPPATASAPAPRKVTQSSFQDKTRYLNKDKGLNAIERIVLRLRNLGLTSDDEGDEEEEAAEEIEFRGGDLAPVTGEERLADLLQREWVRPDTIFSNQDDEEDDDMVLPWERKESERKGREEGEGGRERKRTVKAPTLAELTIEDEELRRLRRMGMFVRERVSIPKAGLTKDVLEKIHDKWRKQELVRLKFHEVLAHDMKTAHEITEVGWLLCFIVICHSHYKLVAFHFMVDAILCACLVVWCKNFGCSSCSM